MSIGSCTCSSNRTHFLPIRQEFVFFARSEWKGLRYPGWDIVYVRWHIIFLKWDRSILKLSFGGCFTKLPGFLRSENEKWFFCTTKRKTSSWNIVRHLMIHMGAQYGHIITNYFTILAITLVVWFERPETSNMIGHFVKGFLRHTQFTKFGIFTYNYVT